MIQKIGPTGNVVTGHVLDVSKEYLLEKLRDYDPLLYVKWNPKKNAGNGLWELRRRPEKKSAVLKTECKGFKLYELEYVEIGLVNHVLDTQFLTYDVLNRLREMDTWNKDHWIHDIDYHEAKAAEKIESEAKKELAYNVKQHKREFNDFREYVLSGHNPARIAEHWNKAK